MDVIGLQIAVVFALLLVIFSGPAIGLWTLHIRKRRVRAARRSPLTTDLLRGPGHTLREQIEDMQTDATLDLTLLIALPLTLAATHLAQSYWLGTAENALRTVFIVTVDIVIIAWLTRRLLQRSEKLDAMRLGLDAEVAVGQELDQLMRQGAAVFHDFPAEKFNIDHVVICPSGVFAVETKGRSKLSNISGRDAARVDFDGHTLKFPAWTETAPLEQAERQTRWLQAWLSKAIASEVNVIPAVALPGWYINRSASGGVCVFNPRNPQFFLRMHTSLALTPQDIQRIAHQVEQRCRTVRPSYRSSDV